MTLRYPKDEKDRIGQSFVHFTFLDADDNDTGGGESTITLFIPQGLNFNDNVNYGTSNFGAIGEFIQNVSKGSSLGTTPAGRRGARNSTGGVSDTLESIKNQFDTETINAISSYALVAAGASAASSILGNGALAAVGGTLGAAAASDAIGLGTGRVFNPNTKTIFQGVGIRSFTLSFPMIASSSDEAQEIDEITRAFRRQMYPAKVTGGDGFSAFLKYPNKVKVQFFTAAEGTTPKYEFKPCFITNVNRSINNTSPSFHEDGEPVELTLSISFTEDTMLTQEDITGGL